MNSLLPEVSSPTAGVGVGSQEVPLRRCCQARFLLPGVARFPTRERGHVVSAPRRAAGQPAAPPSALAVGETPPSKSWRVAAGSLSPPSSSAAIRGLGGPSRRDGSPPLSPLFPQSIRGNRGDSLGYFAREGCPASGTHSQGMTWACPVLMDSCRAGSSEVRAAPTVAPETPWLRSGTFGQPHACPLRTGGKPVGGIGSAADGIEASGAIFGGRLPGA